jgi:hypothetical protein
MTVTVAPRATATPAMIADANPALPGRCTTRIGTGAVPASSSASAPVPSGEPSSTTTTSSTTPGAT